mmetsp:Transcript_55256/g.123514  ORF Transcript_55256/g.123514 Transcript_55256/m.123514 type:complete len:103 (-) Transcript_55256:864-1172(-)
MPYTTALCCVSPFELSMVHQNSTRFYGNVAYDTEFNGLVTDDQEGSRLASVLQGKSILLHQNHGVIVCGRSVAEERTCTCACTCSRACACSCACSSACACVY